jgi:hypothetical protein
MVPVGKTALNTEWLLAQKIAPLFVILGIAWAIKT